MQGVFQRNRPDPPSARLVHNNAGRGGGTERATRLFPGRGAERRRAVGTETCRKCVMGKQLWGCLGKEEKLEAGRLQGK